jgi:hypothetical protein
VGLRLPAALLTAAAVPVIAALGPREVRTRAAREPLDLLFLEAE